MGKSPRPSWRNSKQRFEISLEFALALGLRRNRTDHIHVIRAIVSGNEYRQSKGFTLVLALSGGAATGVAERVSSMARTIALELSSYGITLQLMVTAARKRARARGRGDRWRI